LASQSRKHRGYASQRIVAERLRALWPLAEPTGAGRQGNDILATPGAGIEVKAQANISLPAFIKQAKTNAGDEHGKLIPCIGLRLLNERGERDVGLRLDFDSRARRRENVIPLSTCSRWFSQRPEGTQALGYNALRSVPSVLP